MNRRLHYLNLAGVLLLAGLCVVQWRLNRTLNLRSIQNEKVREEQSKRLEDQDKTIKGQASDLDAFREQLSRLSASLKEAGTNFAAAERQIQKLGSERDQLKASVTNWTAAVSARDEQVKQANVQLKELAEDRNATVTKFNELAAKYNAVVKDLNEARAKLAAIAASQTNRSQ